MTHPVWTLTVLCKYTLNTLFYPSTSHNLLEYCAHCSEYNCQHNLVFLTCNFISWFHVTLAIVTTTPGDKHLSEMCNEPDGYRHECVRRDVHEDQRYERVYSVGGEGLNPLHVTSLFYIKRFSVGSRLAILHRAGSAQRRPRTD